MTTKERPALHPDSPLQSWEQICMLAAMGVELQYRSGRNTDAEWTAVSEWFPDSIWWNDWTAWSSVYWLFRRTDV